MKFKKAIIAVILSLSVLTTSACGVFGESSTPSYTVNLVLNGGAVDSKLESYTEGKEVTLPVPVRENFDFVGWYESSDVSGETVASISSSDTGDKTFYAKWSPKTYSVDIEANGGTVSEALTSYVYMTGATLPQAEKTGYTFGGWFANEACTGNAVTAISATDSGNKSYYAKWTANVYDVTLVLNDGQIENNITSYTYGTRTELGEPARKGYRFLGWYGEASFGGERITEISATDTGNKSFYAKWEEAYGNVTLHANGGTLPNDLTQYQEGFVTDLPVPVKNYYDFGGWYDNAELNGTSFGAIPETATGDVELWAEWTAKKYKVTLEHCGGASGGLTEYTYGTGAALPTATRQGFTFDGWFTQQTGGTRVTQISASDYGDKTFYAHWTETLSTDIAISACAGYNEGIYVEFPKIKNVSDSAYSVEYKMHSEGDDKYVAVDKQLIRVNSSTNTVRADIVGIAAGAYDIVVKAGTLTPAVKTNISVTAHDRSGYAHFNATSGVGGYNDDGTPKSGAIIVYVDEATKNSVQAKLGSTTYTGIVNILKNLSKSSKPVIIRFVGTVSAATWSTIEYNTGDDIGVKHITPDDVINKTPGTNGAKLSKQNYTQKQLYDGGFNTYNTSVASRLDNLEGTLKYDSSKKEFDSCWNDCQISEANNVTLEGIGTDAGLFQWGLTWKKSNSIEVRNLTFKDYTEDACSFEGDTSVTNADNFNSKRIWLHNNTFNIGMNYWDVCNEQDKHDGDGSTDFKGTSYVTISYNHYIKTHKTGLIGGGDSHKSANITFHHNYYQQCKSRLPLARQANMHMYNNYYYKSTDTNMSIRAGGYAFIEACYFENAVNPVVTQDYNVKNSDNVVIATYRGVVKLYGCTFIETGVDSKYRLNTAAYNITVASSRTQTVTNDNVFNKTFDTDSNAFYYENGKTKASLLTSAAQAKTDCLNMAGVLKASK